MSEKPNPDGINQGYWNLITRVLPLSVAKLARNSSDDDPRKIDAIEASSNMAMSPEELLGEQSVDDSQKEGE